MASGLPELARLVSRCESVLGGEVVAAVDLGAGVRHVSEQRAAGRPGLRGKFDVVAVVWKDITAFTVDADGVRGKDKKDAMKRLGGEGDLLRFLQVGILVREDDEKIAVMHSVSLSPNRSEFFVIPKAVIVERHKLGQIEIADGAVKRS